MFNSKQTYYIHISLASTNLNITHIPNIQAFLHHVPDSGKLLVIFAPHVGIDEIGRVGSLQRDGQSNVSTACGAAVGAYKQLQKAKKTNPDPLAVLEQDNPREYDPQLKNIVSLLAPRLDGIDESADSIAFVTYQMYGIIRELITACITETPDLFDFATEVAVVGGVMINRRKVCPTYLFGCVNVNQALSVQILKLYCD